jgi:hypothetical protein
LKQRRREKRFIIFLRGRREERSFQVFDPDRCCWRQQHGSKSRNKSNGRPGTHPLIFCPSVFMGVRLSDWSSAWQFFSESWIPAHLYVCLPLFLCGCFFSLYVSVFLSLMSCLCLCLSVYVSNILYMCLVCLSILLCRCPKWGKHWLVETSLFHDTCKWKVTSFMIDLKGTKHCGA